LVVDCLEKKKNTATQHSDDVDDGCLQYDDETKKTQPRTQPTILTNNAISYSVATLYSELEAVGSERQ